MLHPSGGHFLTKPRGNRQRIEAYRASNLEARDAVARHEFVDLPLGDIQQFCDIRDHECTPFPVEAIGEIAGFLAEVVS
jgi:hypothetical protein